MEEDNSYWIYITAFISFLGLLNYFNLRITEPDELWGYLIHLFFPIFGFGMVFLSYKKNKSSELFLYEKGFQLFSFLANVFLLGATFYFFATFEFKIM